MLFPTETTTVVDRLGVDFSTELTLSRYVVGKVSSGRL